MDKREQVTREQTPKLTIGETVKILMNWQSYNYDKCFGCELHGEKGVVVGILSARDKVDGYRVRFPAITVWNEDGKEKQIKDFIWPFRRGARTSGSKGLTIKISKHCRE